MDEDSGQNRVESGPHSWSIQLDQDLLDTIIAIYPEWFKEYSQKRGTMLEGSGGESNAPQSLPSAGSPGSLVAEVDESPLQKTMDKNKESLKVKLMMRRPINQLVAQGIMPSLKTPPAFHEQRQKLERAKMGDLLKAKIQQRPDREELVRQHILEADVGHVDPSLAERQRMLKKARLADSLNDQLSHRPGPLELIKKNILHTEEPIERAVKEGVIPFKATSEGQLRKPQHPDHYITFEDDSQSSEGGGSPPNASSSSFPGNSAPALESEGNKTKESRPRDVLETAAASAGIVNVAVTIPTNAVVVTSPILQQIPNDKNQTLQTFAELCSSVVSPLSLGSSTSSLSPLSSIASPPAPLTPRPASLSSPAPGKADKNRKKSKTKTQPKARTIKFHEYKGPPNAQKNNSVSASSTETSYELLLQQQQLFLQWQLEWQHKYPQIILPAAQKPTSENINNLQNTMSNLTNGTGNGGTTFLVTHSPRSSTPVVQSSAPQTKSPSSPAQPTESQASNQNSSSASSSSSASTSTFKILTKLEDMKVSDLKMELKKRNLPVSGPKPQLIERLKPFTQTGNSEQHQSEATNRNASNSNGENPGSVWSEMEITTSPIKRGGDEEEAEEEEEKESFSPGAKTVNSLPPSPAPSAMDTSEPSPPSSPTNGELIIQQQKKIEELQRELQKSQQQLQQIREGKDSSKMATAMTSSIPVKALLQNGIIHIDPKSQQKLILQQHLQNKIQQQQLQVQLQQQQKGQMNESLNAKANLAAFINQQQAQQQAQQQHNSILQTTSNNASREANNGGHNSNNISGSVGNTNNNFSNNSNNIGVNGNSNSGSNNNNADNNNNAERNTEKSKNSNNNNINNNNNNVNSSNNNNNNIKNKALERRSIVLGQQQAAIVLNHLNLVKQKNGIFGHQRTSSLPTFLGALVQNAINTEDKHLGKTSIGKVKNQNAQQKRAGSEEQQTFVVTSKPPPPEYEEATKSLKKDAEESKSVKSQIVDDVLEILIKNGELPPSAANDPATPTANCRSGPFDQESLVFSRRATPPPPPPPPPLPQPGFSVTLPTSITLTSQPQSPPRFNLSNGNFSSSGPFTLTTQSLNPPTYTLTQAYLAASSEGEPGRQASDAAPASNITFSITNANFTDNSSKNTFSSGLNYLDQTEYMSTETSDFPLNNSNDQNFHSNSLDYILSSSELSSSNNTMLPSEYGNGDINLRELGLDLETLDTMDFSQFDCKMDVNESELETGGGTASSTPTPTPSSASASASITNSASKLSPSPTSIKTDQLINNNPDLVKPELMEPMDMGDNWLDSLMSSSENSSGNGLNSYSAPGYEFLQCGDSSYDSLLGSGQDPFELFDIHDNDFKLPSSSLSWDKVDFAT